ncbi:hypothetical protein G1K46_12605 [Tenacibaculum finnmarkense]|uniref:toxin-antitoxin system YwqK family antitoxin n=1 Tax=Tenacibaculum finnmarkense TaxID=2781243 RepID=UPI001EFB0568|nr:hypothetical protein [Tenacibaculum finnmarkense]MCG8763557.1 hypothetical protein [Tenacibaculum finnmarkense]MCG8788938.1 hypothetical protein [Tenacibaculum finnmarkense]
MKIRYFLLLFIIFSSCKGDISDETYRNENHVFYQEDGKAGKWQKIKPELEIELPKSHSTYFFPNGNRYAELKVIDSFPNRILKFFNKENKLIRTVKYQSDSIVSKVFENGNYKGYHSNLGLLQSEGLFENNMYHGKWKFYHEDGKTVKQIVEYVNDTLHGIREDYWENGKLKSKAFNIKGELDGESINYYKTGELEEVSFFKNNQFHRTLKHYFKNGNIEFERNYWNGKRKDTCITYFENGDIERFQIYDLDTLTMKVKGKEYVYFDTGELKLEVDFIGYSKTGKLVVYNKNGVVVERSEKRNNKHQGAFTTYYDSGLKKLEGKFYDGYFDGKLNYYDTKGKITKTVNYDNGTALDSIMY